MFIFLSVFISVYVSQLMIVLIKLAIAEFAGTKTEFLLYLIPYYPIIVFVKFIFDTCKYNYNRLSD